MNKIYKFMEKYYLKIVFIIIPVILLLALMLFLTRINKENNKYTTEKNEFYQYFKGKKYDYNGVITIDNNNILEIKLNDKKISDYSSPLYYKNSDKFILPSDMSIVSYEGEIDSYLLNYFTIIYKTNNYYIAEYNDKEAVIGNQFLYDGYDTYLFFDEVDIYVGEEKYSLKPMSYVTVTYNGDVELYNYNEEPIMLPTNNYVHAKFKMVDINLNEDILNNGYKSFILYSRLKDLNSYIG